MKPEAFIKCRGEECPVRQDCKRYTAPVDPYFQGYFFESPIAPDGTCKFAILSEIRKDSRNKERIIPI